MSLFVWNTDLSEKISATITPATSDDLKQTMDWQTQWTSRAAREMPNKVALRRRDNAELLGLMSYELDEKGLAVEVIYLESAGHSNANLLHTKGGQKKYIGIAKAFFAYAAAVSVEAGFGGVLFSRQKPLSCGNTIHFRISVRRRIQICWNRDVLIFRIWRSMVRFTAGLRR